MLGIPLSFHFRIQLKTLTMDHIIPHRHIALSLKHKWTIEAVKRLIVVIMELMIQMISKLPPPKAPLEKDFNVLEAMEKAIMDLGFKDFNKLDVEQYSIQQHWFGWIKFGCEKYLGCKRDSKTKYCVRVLSIFYNAWWFVICGRYDKNSQKLSFL